MTRLGFVPVISGGQVLTRVELFERIRADRRADPSLSARMLARRYGVSRRTVKTALGSAMPPPRKPPVRSRPLVLTPVLAVVDEMLRSDLSAPRKQRHTIERICQRLAIEHDFTDASYSAVRDYVARRRPEILAEARAGHQHLQGMVPQLHAPGEEAEVDFCEAYAVIAGKSMKCYLFTLRLSFSGRAIHRLFLRTKTVTGGEASVPTCDYGSDSMLPIQTVP
jgi:hypothetical protein